MLKSIVAALVLATVTLVGCGGKKDEPTTPVPDKLAYLKSAAALGDKLRPALAPGSPAAPARDIARAAGATVTPTANGLVIRFDEHVYWDVTVDKDDVVQGFLASGYGELMDTLGIDFAGRPHVPGN